MPTLSPKAERHLLQAFIAVAGFVPVGGGLAGAIVGGAMAGEGPVGPALDSHVRYLSGLLIGIGLAYWEAIPKIERRAPRIRLLTLIVMLGGLVRLIGFIFVADPGRIMSLALVMELVVTPLVCLWQARVGRRLGWDV